MSHITVPGRTGEWPLIGSVTVERKLLQHQGVELTRKLTNLGEAERRRCLPLFTHSLMPQDSDHDCSGQECHDHSHDQSDDLGPQDNLYTYIDRQNVVALNIGDYQSSSIIKPWHLRMDESLVSMITEEFQVDGNIYWL